MNYTITEADLLKDRADILAIWKRNFTSVPEGQYSWIYGGNPDRLAAAWLLT